MYQYSIIQWLFFFYFYCFGGWCFESVYVSIREKKWTNRGFLRGPFLPIYGSGATMMLVVSAPYQDNIVLTYISGCIGATLLELIVGIVMEAIFKVRYWDYSKKKFNFKGQICLSSTLAWGGFTILMTEIIHVPIEKFALSLPYKLVTGITFAISVLFAADFALSFKAAIDIRDLLFRMSQTKKELLHIQRRLDVLVAVAGEGVSARKDDLVENLSGIKNGIKGSISDLKSAIESKLERAKSLPEDYPEDAKAELGEIKTKYAVLKEIWNRFGGIKDFFQRDMIISNDMTSEEYEDSLDELKKSVRENQ